MYAGILAPPSDFRIENQHRNIIKLQWNLPFTFDGIPIESVNIYYSDGVSEGLKVAKLPGNSTSYDFKLDGTNPDPCLRYSFSVTATNEVGESESTDVIEGSFLSGELSSLITFL